MTPQQIFPFVIDSLKARGAKVVIKYEGHFTLAFQGSTIQVWIDRQCTDYLGFNFVDKSVVCFLPVTGVEAGIVLLKINQLLLKMFPRFDVESAGIAVEIDTMCLSVDGERRRDSAVLLFSNARKAFMFCEQSAEKMIIGPVAFYNKINAKERLTVGFSLGVIYHVKLVA